MKIIVLLDQILTDLVSFQIAAVLSVRCAAGVRGDTPSLSYYLTFHTHFANNSQANHNLNKSTQTASKHDFNSM